MGASGNFNMASGCPFNQNMIFMKLFLVNQRGKNLTVSVVEVPQVAHVTVHTARVGVGSQVIHSVKA